MKSPLDDGGPLQAADDEGVWLGPLCLHQLTFWKSHRDPVHGVNVVYVLFLRA